MTSHSDLSGIWVPLVTPFTNGTVDHRALGALVQRLARAGVRGFVACGSTGEPQAMDEAEQRAVLDTVLAHAGGKPVVMGLSGYHLQHLLERLRALSRGAVAAVLVPPPPYVRPSQAGIVRWFERVAQASAVPVIVYDIPVRTGVCIERATYERLARQPDLVAVKDCANDAAKTQWLIDSGRWQVLCGDDGRLFESLAAGARGGITASAHLCTERFVQLDALLAEGRRPEARALWAGLAPLTEALFAEPNPAPLKAALAQLGELADELREPLLPAGDALRARLRAMLSTAAA